MAWQTLSLHFKQTYEGGYRYLDKCGEFMLAATDKMNVIPGEPKPTGAKLEIPEEGVNITCDSSNLAIAQELPIGDQSYFINLCVDFAELVATHFQPREIISNGFAWKS